MTEHQKNVVNDMRSKHPEAMKHLYDEEVLSFVKQQYRDAIAELDRCEQEDNAENKSADFTL